MARHGHDGSSSEEGGYGALMAKCDGFFILRGRHDLGSSHGGGGLHGKEWRRRLRTTAGPRASPSVVSRPCSKGWMEPGPAQTAAVTAYLHRLGVLGASEAV
jgi:hypothetical protein